MMVVVLVYFPIRYLLLLRGVGRGDPRTYVAIRGTARFQLAFEIFRLGMVLMLNANTVELPPEA